MSLNSITLIGLMVGALALFALYMSWQARGEEITSLKASIKSKNNIIAISRAKMDIDKKVSDNLDERKRGLREFKQTECGVPDVLRYVHDSMYDTRP